MMEYPKVGDLYTNNKTVVMIIKLEKMMFDFTSVFYIVLHSRLRYKSHLDYFRQLYPTKLDLDIEFKD